MIVTLNSQCGTGATVEIIGNPSRHRITVLTGANAINGTLMTVSFDGQGGFNTDNVSVMPIQIAGFNLGRITPQGADSTGYELMVENCPAGSDTFVIDCWTDEIPT